jgi:hypothetical protein
MYLTKAIFASACVVAVAGMLTGCGATKRHPSRTYPPAPVSTLPAISPPTVPSPTVPLATVPDTPKPTVPKPKPERPLVVDAKTFAQELFDDTKSTAIGRYVSKTLEIEGVVGTQATWDGGPIKDARDPIGIIDFHVPVTDSRKGGTKDFKIHCRFKEPVPPADGKFAGLAKGKIVTIHGHLTESMAGQPDATLNDCVIIR